MSEVYVGQAAEDIYGLARSFSGMTETRYPNDYSFNGDRVHACVNATHGKVRARFTMLFKTQTKELYKIAPVAPLLGDDPRVEEFFSVDELKDHFDLSGDFELSQETLKVWE